MNGSLHEVLLRIKTLFHRSRKHRELAEELAFHQSMMREKLLQQGVTNADEAMRRNFGDAARWQERLCELWQFTSLENLLRDLNFSARLLMKSPGFTAVAILTLALGIGANTAIFSIVNGLLLRPLPVPHSDRLAVIRMDNAMPTVPGAFYYMSAPFFRSLESRHEVFADTFACSAVSFPIRGPAGNEVVDGQYVSGGFFRALETPPQVGRGLTEDDDRPGGNPAGLGVVISDHFWKSRLGAAPDVLGRKLQIANTVFVVVGVMPKQFRGASPLLQPEIFVPLATEAMVDAPQSMIDAGYRALWLQVMGRLQPGVTIAQANAALLPVSMPIVRSDAPDPGFAEMAAKNHFRFSAEPGSRGFTFLRTLFRKPLLAIFAMCGGMLLLACLNLASLLMARSASRERELATRMALGASRRRLIQQLLTDSLMVAAIATVAGLATGPAVSRLLAAMMLGGRAPANSYLDTSLDGRALAFAALAALAAALLVGLLPALRVTSRALSDQIRERRRVRGAEQLRRALPRIIMASQVALALILVVGAGLLTTSLRRLYTSGAGFDPNGVANLAFDMDQQPLNGDPLVRLYRQIADGLSHQPEVKSVSFAQIIPLTFPAPTLHFSVPGKPPHDLAINTVGPAYFQTMRIPLLEGREFQWSDDKASGYKVVLNRAAAKMMFPGQDAIGQHIVREMPNLRSPASPSLMTTMEVIAIVGDTKYTDFRTVAPPTAYSTISQNDSPARSFSAVVRIDGKPGPLAAAARLVTERLAPQVPAPVMTSMEGIVNDSLASERMMAGLSGYFALCALLVTAVGLYGTLAYSTAQRTGEIGVRMALGARRLDVLALVFGENAMIAFTGSLAGLIATAFASRLLAGFLYQTSVRDPRILLESVATLSIIASAASLLPAWRAARIEPAKAIRCE